jgi:acetyl esterase/lipase
VLARRIAVFVLYCLIIMLSKRLLVVGIFAVHIVYMVYTIPIPEGTSEPHKLRASLVPGALLFGVINFLDLIGLMRDYKVIRWLRQRTIVPTDGLEVLNTTMDGVRVRVYKPKDTSKRNTRKAMVFYHGGGWMLGSIDTHNEVTAYFAKEAGMVVVSIGYRLIPEHSKNDGLDDCIRVTKYVIDNAAELGVDSRRVVVAGDSAGGNYAAAVALYLRDQQFSPMPKIQLLIYPNVQGLDVELPSFQQNAGGPALHRPLIDWFQSYLTCGTKRYIPHFRANTYVPSDVRVAMAKGVLNHDLLPNQCKYPPYEKPKIQRVTSEIWHKISKDYMDPYYFPLMANNHSGLPPAYIFTAQFDPLRDEGYLYAHKLRQDGVNVTHYNSRHGWHGMVSDVHKLRDATEVMKKMVDFIEEQL